MKLKGIWLPIITPMKGDKIDYVSYERLINHYVDKGIEGFIPLGTTGEVPTLTEYEFEEMIEKTVEFNSNRLPIYAGIGGNYTAKVIERCKIAERYPIQGMLSVCPYYNKPSQEGIYQHFNAIASETNLNIIIYNIPYRTGVNIENKTIYRLAEIGNIVGIKDSCGDMKQTLALLMNRPDHFSILTGEDAFFFSTLALGGDGGILASSHIQTEKFVDIYHKMKTNNMDSALETWKKLCPIIPLLFKEPNPAPIKYLLEKEGLIASSELRLPLTKVSASLAEELDLAMSKFH